MADEKFDKVTMEIPGEGAKDLTPGEFRAVPIAKRVDLLVKGQFKFFKDGKPVPAMEALPAEAAAPSEAERPAPAAPVPASPEPAAPFPPRARRSGARWPAQFLRVRQSRLSRQSN